MKRAVINWQPVMLVMVSGVVVYLVVGPLGMLLFSSLRTVGPTESGPFTLANYINAYLNAETYELLLTTSLYTLVATSVGLVIGVFSAWLVERTNAPLRNVAFALIPLNIAVPGMLYSIAWLLLLSPEAGIINIALMNLFRLETPPLNPYGIVGMGFVEGIRLASIIFLMMAGIFRAVDPSLEEAAFASGANVAVTTRRVTLPLVLPGIWASAIYGFTTAFDSFEIPVVLGLPRGVHVFATKIYEASHQSPPDYGMSSTLGMILLLLATFWVYLYGRATRYADSFVTVTGKGYRPRVLNLGMWKYAGTAFFLIYFLIVVIAPAFILIWGSLLPYYELPSMEALSRISLDSYTRILSFPWLPDASKNTLILILAAPLLVVILSTLVAWIVVRTRIPGRKLLDVLAFLPHAVPGIVMGLALLWLYSRMQLIPIYGTIGILLLAYTTKHMAYGTRSMSSAMIQLHRELEEAGQISGASCLTIISKITVPLLMPSFTAVWIWSAIHVSREMSMTVMLYSPQSRTIAVLIWDLWASGEVADTCAIGVILLIILAVLLYLGRLLGYAVSTS
ncbi:MAG: iron ABC transporter permease [Deltaproteobacteria bacterium]|nr:iron ABC transporter permease [Deltaproteobacteria bacterium]